MDALDYVYKIPYDFPESEIEFVAIMKKRLDRGEFIDRTHFLELIDKVNIFSPHWHHVERVIEIFRKDPNVNVKIFEMY